MKNSINEKSIEIAEAIVSACNKFSIKDWQFKGTIINNYWAKKKIKNIVYNMIKVAI